MRTFVVPSLRVKVSMVLRVSRSITSICSNVRSRMYMREPSADIRMSLGGPPRVISMVSTTCSVASSMT